MRMKGITSTRAPCSVNIVVAMSLLLFQSYTAASSLWPGTSVSPSRSSRKQGCGHLEPYEALGFRPDPSTLTLCSPSGSLGRVESSSELVPGAGVPPGLNPCPVGVGHFHTLTLMLALAVSIALSSTRRFPLRPVTSLSLALLPKEPLP